MFRVPKRIHLYVCDQLFAAFFKKMHHSLHDVMRVVILILIEVDIVKYCNRSCSCSWAIKALSLTFIPGILPF